ncbi:hypothetical protein Efla_005287 [Eimeria flavescens]
MCLLHCPGGPVQRKLAPSLSLFAGSSLLSEAETDEVDTTSSSSRSNNSNSSSSGELTAIQTLTAPAPFRQIHEVLLSPEGLGPRALCAADSEKCSIFACGDGGFQALGVLQKQQMACEAAAWDPHDSSILLTAHSRSRFPCYRRTGGSSGGLLAFWDLRASLSDCVSLGEVPAASSNGLSCLQPLARSADPHSSRAAPSCVSFNYNMPFCFLTGGTDGAVRSWDKRRLHAPVKVLRDVHSHWITHALLNPFHDELLLTAGTGGAILLLAALYVFASGTDGCIKLQRLEVELAAPSHGVHTPEIAKREADKKLQDQLLCVDESSDDCLAALCWSCCEAWSFASLGMEGTLSFHEIPPAEKYRILL